MNLEEKINLVRFRLTSVNKSIYKYNETTFLKKKIFSSPWSKEKFHIQNLISNLKLIFLYKIKI